MLAMADRREAPDKNIELWEFKKEIKELEAARGNGTSMISLIIPPGGQISFYTSMLTSEYGTASNIKKRVNRQSVEGAIKSALQLLKTYKKVPPNGLVLYTGTIITEDRKEHKVTTSFEPLKPINVSLYRCDNRFHTEDLNAVLESDEKFGFIIMSGKESLFGTLSGNVRQVLQRYRIDPPKRHSRGGQSALRFARLGQEARDNHVSKTAEFATRLFIDPATNQPNVQGLVLAGSADFKTKLGESSRFDPRLAAKILKVVDVSKEGEDGFIEAINLSAEVLSNVKFIQEKQLLAKYFEEVEQDTGMCVFGLADTLTALDMRAVKTLIVDESLEINRYVLRNSKTGEIVVKHFSKEQENNKSNSQDSASSGKLEIQEKMPLVEWFADEYKLFGCTLELVTDRSPEGSKFKKGFGGIGGVLQYQLDMRSFDESDDDDYVDGDGEVYGTGETGGDSDSA